MARKYQCEVCGGTIEENTGAVFEASTTFGPQNGRTQPVLKVKVDVCSSRCLVQYATQKLIPDIAKSDAKWRTYGTSSVAPVGQPLGLRFGDGEVPAARRLKR
jgi:hypothetical protein